MQNKNLGDIPQEFMLQIIELKNSGMIYEDMQSKNQHEKFCRFCSNSYSSCKWLIKNELKSKWDLFTPLPQIDDKTSGSNVKKPSITVNLIAIIDSIILLAISLIISHYTCTIIGWIWSYFWYLIFYYELFSDGFIIIDTTPPVSSYRRIEFVPCSANIIYKELAWLKDIEKYDLMAKEQPYSIYENRDSHLICKKFTFQLPEYFPYKPLWSDRVWYITQYHGVDENGVCFILSKKAKAYKEWYTEDIEINNFDEKIIIVPISEAESKVIFISSFNYGGQLPWFIKNSISIERLKYLDCIVSDHYYCSYWFLNNFAIQLLYNKINALLFFEFMLMINLLNIETLFPRQKSKHSLWSFKIKHQK